MISYESPKPVVTDTVYLMKKEFSFAATIDGITHDLDFSVSYNEDKEENRKLLSFKCGTQETETGAEFEDTGDLILTAITDWFFGVFPEIDDEDEEKSKEIDEIFEVIWEFIAENCLA